MENIQIFSPIDNEKLGEVKAMTPSEIDEKIARLNKKFKEYRNESLLKRVEYIKAAIDELEKNEEMLASLLTKEISKKYSDSLDEIRRSIKISRYTIEEALHLEMEAYSGESLGSNQVSLVIREPIGLILAIAPFNYPINLSLTKIIPALIMGNVVLFKPPTSGSLVCTKMVEILNSKLPESVLEIVTGKGSVIGDYIVENKNVKMINFTGSTAVGNRIKKIANTDRLIMELGGKDSAIVLEDANLELAAKEIVSGAFSYSGQRCTAIKRVLVVDSVSEKLTKLIREKVEKLSVGNAYENKDITHLIDKKSSDFVMNLIKDAISKNATLVIGNKNDKNLVYPTVLDNVKSNMDVYTVEPFGPVLPIIHVKDYDEAIKVANESEYGLQSSIFTKDTKLAFEIAKKLEVGTVQINKKTSRGPDNFPFLGIKNSGVNVQGVKYSLLATTNIKSYVMEI
ncbi:aldehyde dehydrogenase family protein [Oceanivirga miroungae]|uniref:Aldehyde dehydrogenase n=1 Tax=Oceanivirga miroungae TaxID=1130046 RepID=A0A6I8M8D7_9FUSO|nr:aldehyde dehydrogenase family protein [Oceanivirga miroungae]VWL85074.1 aldehyde dehydrogenase [Oceanivirga miroungae]